MTLDGKLRMFGADLLRMTLTYMNNTVYEA